MSVQDLTPGTWMADTWFRGREILCFKCGEAVAGIAVVWNGHPKAIILHPTCAGELVIELAGDARNAFRVIEGKPIAAGVNVKLGQE